MAGVSGDTGPAALTGGGAVSRSRFGAGDAANGVRYQSRKRWTVTV